MKKTNLSSTSLSHRKFGMAFILQDIKLERGNLRNSLAVALLFIAGAIAPFDALAQEPILYDGKDYLTINEGAKPGQDGRIAKVPFSWYETDFGYVLPYEETTSMEPVDNYSGPPFRLGATVSITGEGTVVSNGQSATVTKRDATDAITVIMGIGRDSDEPKSVHLEGLIVFRAEIPFSIVSPSAFSAHATNSFPGGKPTGRWVIAHGDGKLYASEETFPIGTPTFSTGLTTTKWYPIEEAAGQIKRGSEKVEVGPLEGLTGAGVYIEGQRDNVTGRTGAAATVGFRLERFSVEP